MTRGASPIERVVGRRLREARLGRGMTLADVAAKTGLSTGILSKIENAKVSSPISTYYRVAEAIGASPGELFSDQTEPTCFVIRKQEAKPGSGRETPYTYSYESLGFRGARKKMEPFILTYPPHQPDLPRYIHTTEEFIYVLRGRLEFHHAGKRFLLGPGDSVYFDARFPHGGRAYGNHPAVALSIASNA
jgi:transcriptional regulator with XRE-family HTH domain